MELLKIKNGNEHLVNLVRCIFLSQNNYKQKTSLLILK